MPDALSSGRVKLQGQRRSSRPCIALFLTEARTEHDFLQPQPVRRPAVFFVRMILHDWSDDACVTILRHLRAVAAPDTQLVIADTVYPERTSSILGVGSRLIPSSLFPAEGYSTDSAFAEMAVSALFEF